jgi:hypothetical protein
LLINNHIVGGGIVVGDILTIEVKQKKASFAQKLMLILVSEE